MNKSQATWIAGQWSEDLFPRIKNKNGHKFYEYNTQWFNALSFQKASTTKSWKRHQKRQTKRCVCVCANAWQLGMAQRVSPATFRSQKRGYSQYPRAPACLWWPVFGFGVCDAPAAAESDQVSLCTWICFSFYSLGGVFWAQVILSFFSRLRNFASNSLLRASYTHDWPARGAGE